MIIQLHVGTAQSYLLESGPDDPAPHIDGADQLREAFQGIDDHMMAARDCLREPAG